MAEGQSRRRAPGGGAGELRHLQKGERGFRSRSRILPPAERSNG